MKQQKTSTFKSMSKNLQHLSETTKNFNIQKQEQKISTSLRAKTKPFNF
jgi:hypothetical protein